MLKIALCVLVLASLSACHAPERAEVSSVAPLGARSGHSFTYLDEEGARQTALLAGIRGAETPDSREQLQRLLDEAGPALMLIETEAGRDRYDRAVVLALFDRMEGEAYLDADMVRSGQAMVWPRPGADERAYSLYALEAEARLAAEGAWGSGDFTIRDPDPDRLAQTLDSAQIIEGRVVAVGEARNGRLYLNFGLNWRTDFTVSLNRADRERFEAQGLSDPAELEGAVIRVRGWLYAENGPMIHVSSPAQIEILDAPDPTPLP
ncbi:hypothetical protein [Oceanicaulis sp. UBA2681]|uniref:hypothetical protein n=1 Tax=Oceanicaulis sp. UBA2681 TaxID=1947007 RepID=UPI000EC1D976|nr:hypothetical protein [Oceanicaulis sp. UBA2681]HCR67076.1 hypothetical protein [Oceanicaulis sp.]|tara:strand:- start:5766 stop:6557 length:792 start_codon:yes stop_codon:yes gene_type:complete